MFAYERKQTVPLGVVRPSVRLNCKFYSKGKLNGSSLEFKMAIHPEWN